MANEKSSLHTPAKPLSEQELAARMLKDSLIHLLTDDQEIRGFIRDIVLDGNTPSEQTSQGHSQAEQAAVLQALVETKIGQLVRPEALRRALYTPAR